MPIRINVSFSKKKKPVNSVFYGQYSIGQNVKSVQGCRVLLSGARQRDVISEKPVGTVRNVSS
jgi:hypothetical protein